MKKKDICLAAILLLAIVLVCAAVLLGGDAPDGAALPESGYSLYINEICTKNNSIIADNDGKFRDYIELYNAGDTISLDGFSLNDGKVSCSPFDGVTLEKDEYLLVFLGDEITGFALGASGGDCIQLLDADGAIVVQANTASLLSDQVMLYRSGIYETSYEASPGYPNSAAGISAFRKGSATDSLPLVVSEVLIGNESSLPDERGLYSDVVELYNAGHESVNLRRYRLSDSPENRHCFTLPAVELAPGKYITVFCDGENYVSESGEIHANFALSHGESLVLSNEKGEYRSMNVAYLGDDISQSLGENGEYTAGAVSLGYENSDVGAEHFRLSRINAESPLVINEVLLSSAGVPYNGGLYDAVEILNRSSEEVSTAGWYLSDGGDPYEYPLPVQTLAPGKMLVIACSPQTTGFGLAPGETLRLTGVDFRHAYPALCTPGEAGQSIVLRSGEDTAAYSFADVSLGHPNTESGHSAYLESMGSSEGLRISELMSANQSYLRGPYGTTADWIELYNGSDETISLSDYCLSDRASDPERFALPDISLKPGGYCVILLSSDPTNLSTKYESLPFNLSSSGEQLYLSRGGHVEDYVFLPALAADEAYGRAKGETAFSLLDSPTPGFTNSKAAEKCPSPISITPQGCYDGIEYLDVELSGEGDIYYTTSCYYPGENASLYTGPIRITETTVIRAVCRQSGKEDSELLNLSYIINENDTLPVVSVVTDPANLWSYEGGIYVTGPNASDEPPFFGANYWNDWEKPVCVSLFETDGSGFSVDCGLKVFGGFTRSMAKKSLSCNFRDVYGCGELAYPLFGEDSFDTYEAFVLRTGGQDSNRARMRDILITSLADEHLGLPVQDYKPVIVYLNGEYWGVHNIREKLNSNYLAAHYNVLPDSLNIVKGGGWANPEYVKFAQYAATHDMTVDEYYDYVCSRIDVDNYIDFIIAEMWIANLDDGNVKYFLSPEGKWTWILYDTDLSFLEYTDDPFPTYLLPTDIGSGDTNAKTFAAKLIKNEEFRDKFLTRMAWQINNVWTEENINARIDEIISIIGADMPKECERWDTGYAHWEKSVEALRTFAANRNEYFIEYAQKWFDLSDREMRSYGFDV